jgi:hypothetical protein
MQSVRGSNAAAASCCGGYRQRIAGVLIACVTVSGCSASGMIPGMVADSTGPAAIALDSIDGVPTQVFHRLARDLKEEAAARQITMVPRSGQASYRIRGYLATSTEQGATSFTWTWDVYDSAQRRAYRLSGEEVSSGGGRAWAAADDQVVRQIARTSADKLAAFLATARAPATTAERTAAPAERNQSIFSVIDDYRPEAAGIFRIFRRDPAPVEIADPDAQAPQQIPLPRGRPPQTGSSGALAFIDPDQ